jgi:Phage derived protein Gp49-like (DUF891)
MMGGRSTRERLAPVGRVPSAIINAVLKLRELGERLEPPHMKPLQGATGLRELRPKQGRSDWRAACCRSGVTYVIVAVDRHKNFSAMIERAWTRASRYGGRLELR